MVVAVPGAWYNALADLDFELPPDRPAPRARPSSRKLNVPLSLVRQESATKRWIAIPEPVAEAYAQWRPTPLRRARAFERAIGTDSRIYYKYEGANLTGSHKLNTAVAQAYYYRRAGVERITVGTGAGQWGTAMAAACSMFGMRCRVFMVRSSCEAKPYRRTLMELLGAEVVASPSELTVTGRTARQLGDDPGGTLSIALAEALEDAAVDGSAYSTGSGETYSILHQSVIGLEARQQLESLGEQADVLIGSLGAGSNLGGLALPFLEPGVAPGVRVLSVEPAACPKLTRGRYAYDYTDSSQQAPLQKMYTLGHTFAPPAMHAAGLRYHGTAKLVSALYDRGRIEAVAYRQRDVFEAAALFARTEGVLPAPESAHAVRGAVAEALAGDRAGVPRTVGLGISGHGLLDLAAYEAYENGTMVDVDVSDEDIEAALASLPDVPVGAGSA